MENIKKKYDDYQSPFDEQAWEHFQEIKPSDKKRRRGFLLPFIGIACLALLIGAYMFYNASTDVNEPIQDSVNAKSYDQKDADSVMSTKKENILDEEEPSSEMKTSTIPIKNGIHTKKKINTSYPYIKTQRFEKNPLNYNSNDYTTTSIQTMSNPQSNDKKKKDSMSEMIVQKEKLHEQVLMVDDVPVVQGKYEISPLRALNPLVYLEPTIYKPTIFHQRKSLKESRNFIKLNTSYFDSYINGRRDVVPGREIVNKKGFLVSLEYYRSLNKIIALGGSLGYSYALDINNRQFQERDFEKIYFAHANLYLFLVNTSRHKLFIKGGAGLTRTRRDFSSFSMVESDIASSGYKYVDRFQRNTVTDFGLLLEASYMYRIDESTYIGANYIELSANDGGRGFGLSLMKSF